jgi:hypothetical protein
MRRLLPQIRKRSYADSGTGELPAVHKLYRTRFRDVEIFNRLALRPGSSAKLKTNHLFVSFFDVLFPWPISMHTLHTWRLLVKHAIT